MSSVVVRRTKLFPQLILRKFIDISDRWQEDRQNKSEKLVKSKNNADKLVKIKNYRRQNKTDKDGMPKIKKLKTADKDGQKWKI